MCVRGAEHRSVKEPPTLRDRPGPRGSTRMQDAETDDWDMEREISGTW